MNSNINDFTGEYKITNVDFKASDFKFKLTNYKNIYRYKCDV